MNATSYIEPLKTVRDLFRPWGLITTVLLLAAVQIGESPFLSVWKVLLLSGFAMGFIAAGAYCMNDFSDRNLDRVVHPERVIPTGRISASTVLRLSILAFAASGIILAFQGTVSLMFGAVFVILLVAYSPLKNTLGIFGNITMALLPTLVVVYGYSIVKSITGDPSLIFLAAIVFFAILSQEVIRDVEDMDKDLGFRKTLPLQIGPRATFKVVAFLWTIVLALTIFFLLADNRYLALAIATPVAAYGALTVAKLLSANPHESTSIVKKMKIAMTLVVVIFVAIQW